MREIHAFHKNRIIEAHILLIKDNNQINIERAKTVELEAEEFLSTISSVINDILLALKSIPTD